MTVFCLEKQQNIHEAFCLIKNYINNNHFNFLNSFAIKVYVENIESNKFFIPVKDIYRFFYKSRDEDNKYFGAGCAHLVTKKKPNDSFDSINKDKELLSEGQFYFGALRFDEDSFIETEWQNFGEYIFILPLLLIAQEKNNFYIQINFYPHANFDMDSWKKQALTLLENKTVKKEKQNFVANVAESTPTRESYQNIVKRAIASFEFENQKVVLGKRTQILLCGQITFEYLLKKLLLISDKAFLFILDLGKNNIFFGASPELLFRKKNNFIETEALAATVPKKNEVSGQKEIEVLFKDKEAHEHILVSEYLEKSFKENFGVSLTKKNIEIKELKHVFHLLQRFSVSTKYDIDESSLLSLLHPTPAVCGVKTQWAKNFIRNNELFDRGFYAGPLGIISKDFSEFCVAIRSCLCFENKAYLYAASGIVKASIFENEWDELSFKQKSMLEILTNDEF